MTPRFPFASLLQAPCRGQARSSPEPQYIATRVADLPNRAFLAILGGERSRYTGGVGTSNADALMLGQIDRGLSLVRRFANCCIVVGATLVTRGISIFGLALGPEELNDRGAG